MIKTKRINTGIYEFSHKGLVYHVERYPDGSWMLFQVDETKFAERQYMNDYSSKAAALQSVMKHA